MVPMTMVLEKRGGAVEGTKGEESESWSGWSSEMGVWVMFAEGGAEAFLGGGGWVVGDGDGDGGGGGETGDEYSTEGVDFGHDLFLLKFGYGIWICDYIHYLLIEGLRVQSGISTEEPPSTINSTSTSSNDTEELIEMSIPLEDWTDFDKSCGYFGNFTLALRMLLRDSLRDYEPVGIPMFALLQLESVDQMFRVNEVHVTGL
ncbi:hypothetical protein L1987_54619 [Smallanthus sonchifolius]|uniref:Uncharacterized protein n=1 Tax=Smallanthus sonchifolius TaxID=185202 RepID=A0ACB9E8A7_9ASTR|nr:hypothetical protein L1987_54619 [Smallanthus sonchifolius]